MSENKKYYYMKLKENFFTSERMVVLETMPDGILYSNLLLKMYLMSLKHNGILLLHENLPHTPQTIATFTRHQIGTVERALQIFLKLGFVELLTDGAYYMPDIQLLVGRSSTEAERKRRERLRLQAQKLLSNSKADICPPENRDKEIREQKCARTNIIDLQIAALNRRLADKQLRCELTQAAKQFIIDRCAGMCSIQWKRCLQRRFWRAASSPVRQLPSIRKTASWCFAECKANSKCPEREMRSGHFVPTGASFLLLFIPAARSQTAFQSDYCPETAAEGRRTPSRRSASLRQSAT